MHIVIAVSHYYDWAPVPDGVKVSKQHIENGRVKQMHDGKHHMRVHLERPTQTEINLPETVLCDLMSYAERKHAPKSRAEAVASYLQEHTMPEHARPEHFKAISVHDDGPQPEIYRASLMKWVEAGWIEDAKVDALVSAYAADKTELAAFLRQFFNVKPMESAEKGA